jgi:hypothetical protein
MRPAVTSASLLLLLALAAGGCSDRDETGPQPAPGSSASPTSAQEPVVTKTTIGSVTGRLSPQDRRHVVAEAGEVVDRWFDAAYVGGSYPRRDFDDAFPLFTVGARDQARGDQALMSNQDIGRRIDAVTATRRNVRVDVLAARGRAVGMTARFVLDFATSGKLERELEVRGRLLLTHTDAGWKVFGYDVTKGAEPKHEAKDKHHDKAKAKAKDKAKPARKSAHETKPHRKSGKKGGGR